MLRTGVLAEPPLMGRERELEALESALNSAVEGKGKTVFVSGEAGSGKTRLVTEFLNRARAQGVVTLTGWCLSNAAVPYFPFFEAFNAYFSWEYEQKRNGREEIVKSWLIGPTQAQRLGIAQALSPQVWKDQTFIAVAKTLSSISATKPAILFVDDVQWADSASLALIHYIARALKSERVLVLATFRSEQLAPDAEGRPHPLVETLRLMKRQDLVEEIKLANLHQEDVSAIAKNMLGGDLQQALTEKLANKSQGNPLFVVESIRMLHEHNDLIQERDQWRLTSDEIGIPEKIKDIVLQRLDVLSRNQKEVLDAASVIGEKFDIEVLASVLGEGSLETVKILDDIAKNTSLVSYDGKLYRFDHARSRDAVYDEISPALKREYHAKIAESLENIFKRAEIPSTDLAYHYAQAGNEEKAVKYALASGQDALARWSNAEAIKHFTYVLQAVGENPQRSEERSVAMEGLGDAFYANSMFKESMKIYKELGDTTEIGAVRLRVLRKGMESAFQHGCAPDLIEFVKKAEPYVAADRLESARVLISKGRALTLQGKNFQAVENCEAALQIFEEEYSLWDTALALLSIGVNKGLLGIWQEAIASALRSIALFEELGDFRWQMEAYFAAGVTFNMCFLEHEALDLLAKTVEIDEKMKMGDYIRLFHAYDFSATSFFQMGDFEEALSYSLKALDFSKRTDSMWAHGSVYRNLAMLYAIHGDLNNAEAFLEKFMKLPPEAYLFGALRQTLLKAVLFAGKNQWKESNQYFKDHLEWSKAHSEPSTESFGRLLYAWALKRQGRFEEVRVQLEESRKIRREAEASFEHSDLRAHLMVLKQAVVGEELRMRLDLVNVGRKPCLLVRVENLLLDEFKVAALPSWCSLQNGSVELADREISAFQVESVKLSLKGLEAGTFKLNPQAVYVDDLGQTKTCKMNTVNITLLPAPSKVRPGRVSSSMVELDDLLLGGIPEEYSVILTAASSNEKELFIERFLETAAQTGQPTLYLTTETGNAKALAEKFSRNFSLFLCSPQAELMKENLPNLYKLKGVDNLTEIDIGLAKYFRTLDSSKEGARIACVQIVSDVLLQHHAVVTRKWLSSLLANLKVRGFTTLAVIDPSIHSPEEVNAVLGLFDGEIEIAEKETAKGLRQVLRIRKMYNQKYMEKELVLDRERLKQ